MQSKTGKEKFKEAVELLELVGDVNLCCMPDSAFDTLAAGLRSLLSAQCDRNVSTETVARHFNVSVKTIERWVKDERKQFPKPKREGFHKMHFKADEIVEWELYLKPHIDKNK